MFNIWRVVYLAFALEFGYLETTNWLGDKENHTGYVQGMLREFRPAQREDDV